MTISNNKDKKDLIVGEEFGSALNQALIVNQEISDIKQSEKNTKMDFMSTMVMNSPSIAEIAKKKKKQRTDSENECLANYKKLVSKMFKQSQSILFEEKYANKLGITETKAQKMVDSIAPAILLLKGINNDILEKEFSKRGISLSVVGLKETNEVFSSEDNVDSAQRLMTCAILTKDEQTDKETEISETIFNNAVPQKLIYDKDINPDGLKSADFKKIVNLEAKFRETLKSDSSKIEEKATSEAEDKQFTIARNELMLEFLDDMLNKIEKNRN